MVSGKNILGMLVASAAGVAASMDELQLISRLLKRQEPGTPAYYCHDNCGQAIIQARNSANVCTDSIFLTDYQNCLQCAGPDNQNIWIYYGTTLTNAATPCGLSTTPLSGTQPDVGPAIPAGSSAASTTAGSTSTSTPPTDTTSTSEEVTTPTPTPTSTPTDTPDSSTSSIGPDSTTTKTGGPASSGASSSAASSTQASHSASSSGHASGTGVVTSPSSTTSGPVRFTGAANALNANNMALYGAMAFGAMYAVAN
ncbi:hypothetical protein GQ53DRAFT_835168 [Thozetella sp. PMI_491]|nr:hypothetical protein GQ53DRAFT_835168 [Thozetella sp. PMI_491]